MISAEGRTRQGINKSYPFLAAGLAAFVVYMLTLSKNYLGDGIAFLNLTESRTIELLPNHMLYNAFIFLWYETWKLLGWKGNGIIPLQTFSAVWGAFSVGLVSFLVSRLSASARITLLVSIGFAASFSVWLFSTDVEVVTFPIAMNLIVFTLAIVPSARWLGKSRNVFLVGVATSAAILSYQTGVFMVLAVAAGFILRDFEGPLSKKRLLAVYLLTVAVLISGCYISVAHLVYKIGTVREFLHWEFGSAALGAELGGTWGAPTRQSLPILIFGFIRTLSAFPGTGTNAGIRTFLAFASSREKALFISYYVVFGSMVAYLCLAFFSKWRTLTDRYRGPLALFLVSGGFYALFALYWAPSDTGICSPLTVSWWGAVALLLSSCGEGRTGSKLFGRIPSTPEAVALCLVCVMTVTNFFGAILPNKELRNNIEYRLALSLDSIARENDLIFTTGADRIAVYYSYFTKRRVAPVFLLPYKERTPKGVRAELDRRIETAVAEGKDVYFIGMKPGRFVFWREMERLAIDRNFLSRYPTSPCIEIDGEEVLKLNKSVWHSSGAAR